MSTEVIGRHKVGNFDTWLSGHHDRVNAFAPQFLGLKHSGMLTIPMVSPWCLK